MITRLLTYIFVLKMLLWAMHEKLTLLYIALGFYASYISWDDNDVGFNLY